MINLNSPIKPDLNKLKRYLELVNDNGWYTNFGPLHNELTERLEDYLGVKNLLLTNNGTSALQVAGKVLGSESILSTPFSFVATVSAFKWQKDEVVFSDIDRNSYNFCVDAAFQAFNKGCRADTILATHVYGNPCGVDRIDDLAKSRKLKVIYDGAHAFGIKLNGKSIFNYGDASTLSFHATKVFHTVEGGAIVFKDKVAFDKAKEVINFGINLAGQTTGVGINAKLNEYQAAVGLVNLDNIENILEHRCELFHLYRNGLKDFVEMPIWHSGANANGAYMPINLPNSKTLETVTQFLAENQIQTRHYFSPPLDKIFVDNFNYGTPNSTKVSQGILCLPLHAHMSLQDVHKVIDTVKEAL